MENSAPSLKIFRTKFSTSALYNGYALVGYFITSYPTQAHGIIVIYSEDLTDVNNYRRLTNDLSTTQTKPTNGLLTDRLNLTNYTRTSNPLRLSKRQSPTTVLLRTTLTRNIHTSYYS